MRIQCDDKYHTSRLNKVIASGNWAESTQVEDTTDLVAVKEAMELGPYTRIAATLSQVNHAWQQGSAFCP